MEFLKRLFCKHNFKWHCNIYGDMINQYNARSVWKCELCGKEHYRSGLGEKS